MTDDLFHFLEVLVICATALISLGAVLLVVVSKMRHDNPLRALITALLIRVGVTGGLLMVDVPAAGLEPIGGIWDIASMIFLVYFWLTFFRKARHIISAPRSALDDAAGAFARAERGNERAGLTHPRD